MFWGLLPAIALGLGGILTHDTAVEIGAAALS